MEKCRTRCGERVRKMSFLNAASVFSNKKQLSAPIKRVPGRVKDALNICHAYENGTFQIEDLDGMAMYDRGYIFEDVNYINQDDQRKESILLQIMKWMKAMNGQWKLTIANEQMDMKEFMDQAFAPLHGEEYPRMEEGIGAWINEKVQDGTKDIGRVMYLTVTCRSRTREEADLYFHTLDTTLSMLFGAAGSRLYRLSGRERLLVLQKLYQMGKQHIPYDGRMDGKTDAWKNHILPSSIRQHKQYMEMDDTYVSVLYGHSYGTSLDEGKVLHDLANVPYPLYVTIDAEPVEKKVLTDKLQNAHMNNEKAISQEMDMRRRYGQYGAGVSYQKGKKKDELEDYMDQVDENDELGMYIGLLVIVAADSLEELRKRTDSIRSISFSNSFTLDVYNYRQLKALNTALPIGGRQVDHMRFFLTSSAVAFNPYYAQDLSDEGGMCYGLNRTTKHLIRGNRKSLPNPHGMVVGHTGSGKSFMIKETEIAQTLLLTDDDVIILDPNNEFQDIIVECGGQYFDFTPKCNIYLNPFEIPDDVMKGDALARNKFIATKTEYAASFCTAVMTNITVTQEHLAVIGRAVRKVFEDAFSKPRLKRQPTLMDIRDAISAQATDDRPEYEHRQISQILNSLEEYTTGVYDMFAHPSNLDISNRLCGFGLKNVPEGIWEPVMITVMHFLAERINHNQAGRVATHLVVDETQVICAKPSSAGQLLYAVETYRKFGGIVTMAIQNLTRAIELPELRDMFSNCAYKCFLDQGGVDAASLRQIQELSETEFQSLNEDIPGYGLMVWGKKILLFDASMNKGNVLFQSFDTDFHKKAKKAAQEKGKGTYERMEGEAG